MPRLPVSAPEPLSAGDETRWATIIHAAGILFWVIPALIGYLMLKDRGRFIRDHTLTALNFQLTILVIAVIGVVTSIALIGLFILLAAAVLNVVFSIVAATRANRGQRYGYPMSIRFVRGD